MEDLHPHTAVVTTAAAATLVQDPDPGVALARVPVAALIRAAGLGHARDPAPTRRALVGIPVHDPAPGHAPVIERHS